MDSNQTYAAFEILVLVVVDSVLRKHALPPLPHYPFSNPVTNINSRVRTELRFSGFMGRALLSETFSSRVEVKQNCRFRILVFKSLR